MVRISGKGSSSFCPIPKALFFFGAFIPQFLNPEGSAVAQTLLLGARSWWLQRCWMAAYALLAGGAGRWLSRTRVRTLEIGSGLCLIGGGIWLALLPALSLGNAQRKR
jgi:homoserine/homoserine lactone efflux protein